MRAKFVGGELDGAEFDIEGAYYYIHSMPELGVIEKYERTETVYYEAHFLSHVVMSIVDSERTEP